MSFFRGKDIIDRKEDLINDIYKMIQEYSDQIFADEQLPKDSKDKLKPETLQMKQDKLDALQDLNKLLSKLDLFQMRYFKNTTPTADFKILYEQAKKTKALDGVLSQTTKNLFTRAKKIVIEIEKSMGDVNVNKPRQKL